LQDIKESALDGLELLSEKKNKMAKIFYSHLSENYEQLKTRIFNLS
jgi:hypothetical protein